MDYTEWLHKLAVLGVGQDTAARYDSLARAYAQTTRHPNGEVVALCRRLAVEALGRGEPMPETPQDAIRAENARRMALLLDPGQDERANAERLRKRFKIN